MKINLKILSVCVILLLAGIFTFWKTAVKPLLYETFQLVTGVEKLGPNTFRMVPENTPYDRWVDRHRENMPVFEGILIQDVNSVELHPWPALGENISGVYLRFSDYQLSDGRIIALPPSGKTTTQRHLFEMDIYCLSGRGYTMIQQEGKAPERIDWQKRALFSIPLNVRYEHFNESDSSARILAVSSFPLMMNVFDNERIIFENKHEMTERYNAESDYLERMERTSPNTTTTNYVADALAYETAQQLYRREGATSMRWHIAGNRALSTHVAEMIPKIYKKAHRHSSDAFILILSGEGYSVIWSEGRYAERQRINWQEGTLFVPPIYWFHQHFNPGDKPARYLAINTPEFVENIGLRFFEQLKYDMPGIEAEWEKELKKLRPEGSH